MSDYVAWINRIKELAVESWLTQSQRQVYDRLLTGWHSHPFVNLHGAPGAGKTFIARLLARCHNYTYVQDLEDAPSGAAQVVLDGVAYTRSLRPVARALGLERVILISRSPVQEAMPRAELVLTDRDVNQFRAVLSNHCGISLLHTEPEGRDLSEIIRREAIARGDANAHQRP